MWPYRAWRWRHEVETVSNQTGVDVNLIAAIMDRESLCGDALRPPTPRGVGDNGHGRGLMQIDDRYHLDFCEDVEQWGNPYQNILYGTALLRTYIRQLDSEERGVCAYNAGPNRVRKSGFIVVADLDTLTTGGNYVSDVLNRRATFTALGIR
jgi:soluble lytic murein transglycosylase-like protein